MVARFKRGNGIASYERYFVSENIKCYRATSSNPSSIPEQVCGDCSKVGFGAVEHPARVLCLNARKASEALLHKVVCVLPRPTTRKETAQFSAMRSVKFGERD